MGRKIRKLLNIGIRATYDEAMDKDNPVDIKTRVMRKVGGLLVEPPRDSISSLDLDYHEDLIKELHPMRDAPIQDVFPFLTYFNLKTEEDVNSSN